MKVEDKCQVCSSKRYTTFNCDMLVKNIFTKDMGWKNLNLENKFMMNQK